MAGSVAAYAFTEALILGERCSPLRRKLEVGLGVYSISALLLFIGPGLLLLKVYKDAVLGICSSLTTVGPESIRGMKQSSSTRRAQLILVVCGAAIVFLGTMLALVVVHRH